jgi:ABC-type nitrate/sulfonate/bicarbonate transport system substrate-binding protein
MTRIRIGFKAFDAHELLCHFVAERAGLYKRDDLQVELLDITFVQDDALPKDVFQVSCAAALTSALKGTPQRVLFVATDRPFFWLFSSQEVGSLRGLKGRRVATYPSVAPPYHFTKMILQREGVDPEDAVAFIPARDDVARLGLLETGNSDAAVLSSAVSPLRLEKKGLRKLCFCGEKLRIPTTGLAAHASLLQQDPQLASTLVHILSQSLSILHEDSTIIDDVLRRYFNLQPARKEVAIYRKYFTRYGRTTPEIAQGAVDSMRHSLGIPGEVNWQDVYDFSLLDS